jgi:hypothetical protein
MLLIWPVILLVFICCVVVMMARSSKGIWQIIPVVLIFSFMAFRLLFLYRNHLPLARNTVLEIGGKKMKISQFGREWQMGIEKVIKVYEYKTRGDNMTDFYYWRVVTEEKDFIISSLTIPAMDFSHYFGSKMERRYLLFPLIPASAKIRQYIKDQEFKTR